MSDEISLLRPIELAAFYNAEMLVGDGHEKYKHDLLDAVEQLNEEGLISLFEMAQFRYNVAETILEAIRLEDKRRGNKR